ncbi:translation initiation factor SUI1 [Fennellomyces sp. T-0311]|nr:translation initiation factor SUI1 [Fennellomyces sp. T-0311]
MSHLDEELNTPFDPFADVEEEKAPKAANHIHLRIQQRNGRKTLTTLQGLPKQYDNKKILKVFKKEFACNGTIVDDEELGEVLQLTGDQRQKIAEFLIKEGIAKKSEIKVHGF